jgi:hypothetical protein
MQFWYTNSKSVGKPYTVSVFLTLFKFWIGLDVVEGKKVVEIYKKWFSTEGKGA